MPFFTRPVSCMSGTEFAIWLLWQTAKILAVAGLALWILESIAGLP